MICSYRKNEEKNDTEKCIKIEIWKTKEMFVGWSRKNCSLYARRQQYVRAGKKWKEKIVGRKKDLETLSINEYKTKTVLGKGQ
jgi:hypothetical protein